mgnify:CR=1 FL=1
MKHGGLCIFTLLGLLCGPSGAVSSGVTKSTGPPAFFLQDPNDGQCLSGPAFKRCAIDTLWYVTGRPGSYQLHHRKVEEVDDELCLDKINDRGPYQAQSALLAQPSLARAARAGAQAGPDRGHAADRRQRQGRPALERVPTPRGNLDARRLTRRRRDRPGDGTSP